MSVRIHLDNGHAFYTNLDFISGKIILSLSRDENISAIVVKLEGESKTTLLRPAVKPGDPQRNGRDEVTTENHKILYKLSQVFPPPGQPGHGSAVDTVGSGGMAGINAAIAGTSYTLRAGQHEYPFNFKIPFNNMCLNQSVQGFAGFKSFIEAPQQIQNRHIKGMLPPSLTGFPGEAEIKYYVKVTVQRPSLFKENRRSQVGFKFLPIEPPRAPPTPAETFARRSHSFVRGLPNVPVKKGLFTKRKNVPISGNPPQVVVDARLPNPAILTCNSTVPLRILVKKQAESPELVFLVGLQIELIGYTTVRSFDVQRIETGTWVVVSLMGLNRAVGSTSDPVGTETTLDKALWEHVKLPPTVTPTFTTCNLSRKYELEVRVTLGYGHPGEIQQHTQMLPLRFPVDIYSGIAPPAALLDAMASRPAQAPTSTSTSTTTTQPVQQDQKPLAQSPSAPPLPVRPQPAAPQASHAVPASDPLYPPQLMPGETAGEEAPPSYEDAIADDIAPVDGVRPDYSGVTNESVGSEVDEKGKGSLGAAMRKGGGNGSGSGSGSGSGGYGSGGHAVV